MIVNFIVNLFILVSFYIMIAGFGAYLQQEFSINSFLGSGTLAIMCLVIFKVNTKGLVKTNEILVPLLIVIIIFIRNNKYKKY